MAHSHFPRRRRLLLAVLLVLLTLGCLCMPTGLVPTSTPSPASILPPPETFAPPPTETLSDIPTPIPATLPPAPTSTTSSVTLSPGGRWLLIEASQGLWAVNADGSAMTQLTDVDYWRGNVQYAIQPNAFDVAYLTPGDFSFQHMALNLLTLPEGKTTKVTDLTSASTEAYAASGPGDPGFEALRAIGEQRSFAWSPDGSKLAFVGAMDGPSADMYIYDVYNDKIIRVSSDPGQDFSPSWSPDGQHLVYLEAKGFGTGAGMMMSAVWMADGNGSHPTKLYSTSSAGEEIPGWLDNTHILLDTWTITCGSSNLRIYDLVRQSETILAKGCISSATASGFRNFAMYSDSTGTYQLTADTLTSVKVSDEKNARIKPWGPDDQFFTVRYANSSLTSFGDSDLDHQDSPITAPPDASMLPDDQTDVSIYAAIWGWTSRIPAQPGAWITGPGIEIGQIFDRPARFPTWDEDNNFLFFAPLEGGYDLYRITFDSHYSDLQLVNHLDADILGVVWLGPSKW